MIFCVQRVRSKTTFILYDLFEQPLFFVFISSYKWDLSQIVSSTSQVLGSSSVYFQPFLMQVNVVEKPKSVWSKLTEQDIFRRFLHSTTWEPKSTFQQKLCNNNYRKKSEHYVNICLNWFLSYFGCARIYWWKFLVSKIR